VIRADNFETMINPQREIPLSASRVNGITEEMVKDAPLIEDKIDEFMEFFHDVDYTLIHNAKFDLSFINYNLKKSLKKEVQEFKMP
jgi:DNA polymerase III epsilon subunit-like protein